MTFLEMQEEVLAHGFDPNAYRTRAKRWLNEGVGRIRSVARLPEADSPGTLATVAGTASYTYTTAFVRVRSVRYADGTGTLGEVEIEDVDDLTDTGKPRYYALYAGQIVLSPTPDAAYSLAVRVWSASQDMAADMDLPGVPARYAGVAIHYALSKAFLAEDDPELSVLHRQEFDRDLMALRADVQMTGTSNRQVPGMFAASSSAPAFSRP